jgi:hypothetical protein
MDVSRPADRSPPQERGPGQQWPGSSPAGEAAIHLDHGTCHQARHDRHSSVELQLLQIHGLCFPGLGSGQFDLNLHRAGRGLGGIFEGFNAFREAEGLRNQRLHIDLA